MPDPGVKSFRAPDEVVRLPKLTAEIVVLGELTMSRMVAEPGWRWSEHVRPSVGGEWCQVHHVGFVVSGRLGTLYPDGTQVVYGPDDIVDIPPGHDGYVVGDEPCVQIYWAGNRPFFASFLIGSRTSRPRHAALHRSRRLDGQGGRARRCPVESAPLRALPRRESRARALRRSGGEDHGRRVARDLRQPRRRRCAVRRRYETLTNRDGSADPCRRPRRRGGGRRRGRPRSHRSRGRADHGGRGSR